MAVAAKPQTIPNSPIKTARATTSQIKDSWATRTTKQGDKVWCHHNIQTTIYQGQATNSYKMCMLPMSVREETEEKRGLWAEGRSPSKQLVSITGNCGRPIRKQLLTL